MTPLSGCCSYTAFVPMLKLAHPINLVQFDAHHRPTIRDCVRVQSSDLTVAVSATAFGSSFRALEQVTDFKT